MLHSGGITNGGYALKYADKPTEYGKAAEADGNDVDAWWSLGIRVSESGNVADVLVGSPADQAGFGPGMSLIAINGRAYTGALLKDAIDRAKNTSEAIEFIISNTGYFKVIKIDYHGGERYPYLEAIKGQKDLLDEILKPMVK